MSEERTRHVIDEELKALLEDPVRLFARNRDVMKQTFPWQGGLTHALCALLATQRATLLDAPRAKEMRELIRSRTGIFSELRGIPLLPLSVLLSMSLMPEADLTRVEQLYAVLKNAGFRASPYVAETAFLAFTLNQPFDGDACARAAYDMVKRQRSAHPFLESETACMYAFLAAVEDCEPEACQIETELGYQLLKPYFPSAGTTISLSRVLTLGTGETEAKCARAAALYDAFRAVGLKFGKHYELPALGVLSLLPSGVEAIAARVKAYDERIKAEKGFNAWSVQPSERVLFSASLYAAQEIDAQEDAWLAEGLMQSFTGVLIAAQTAACAGAAAAASASAASSSH